MNKTSLKMISSMKNKYLIQCIITLFILSNTNNAVAASPGKTDEGKEATSTIVSPYKGTLAGHWSGEINGYYVSGLFTINISADGTVEGSYSGTQSGKITGSINDSGNFNAQGSANVSSWSGQIISLDGRLSGIGTWEGYGGGGQWENSQNQPGKLDN